ncbi:MAG: hypothetical protein ACK2UK_12485 [Candidatus Promineifilaceae bacterium]
MGPAENFSNLVDTIPNFNLKHSKSGRSIEKLYAEVVNANVDAVAPDPDSVKAYQAAFDLLHSDGIDYDDAGQQVIVKVDSPVFAN